MDTFGYQPMLTLTRTGDLATAHVLVARLQSEGFDAIVRGEPMGPYPVTVGRMAVTEILVPADDLEEARSLLAELETEADAVEVQSGGAGKSPEVGTSIVWWLVALVLLGAIVWIRLWQYL